MPMRICQHQDHMHYRKLWISTCFSDHKREISTTIQNIWYYREKHLNLEMNWLEGNVF